MIHLRSLRVALLVGAFAFLALQSSLFASPIQTSNSITASLAPRQAPTGHLIVSAETNAAWNIYAADPSGSTWANISANVTPARDPAISPDGKTIAFRSKLGGIWEIYAMPISGGTTTRLSRNLTYSGAPVWSPDGKRIAFEGYVRGDLDVWVMNADGTQALDLTESEKTNDYAPAWSPDGKWIVFTSWRTGTQQLFAVSADCTKTCQAYNLSQNKFDDTEAAWSPDGKKIAFVSDRDGQRAIYLADFYITGLKNIQRFTFSGWDDQPTWSPDGQWIAFTSARPTRSAIYILPIDGSTSIPRIVDNSPDVISSVAWSSDSLGDNSVSDSSATTALYQDRPDLASVDSGHPFDTRRPKNARLDGGLSKLNSRVVDSFDALQARTKQLVGYDFLSILSDMFRPVDVKCDVTCDTLSWHKAGRAVDTRLDYSDPKGIGGLEIVREDQQGEVFFRVYLKTAAQDGTMGEPLKDAPWDMSYRARWVVSPGEGGTKMAVPSGFYVDFTDLAQQYGWDRISAHDSADFDWKSNKIGTEYWHFQRLQGLDWYDAMREIYSESDLKSIADWDALVKSGYDPYVLYLKDIPAPAKTWRWNVLGP